MKIEELGLSLRTFNTLNGAGIETLEQLQNMSEREVRAIKGMSDRKIVEIRMAVEKAEQKEKVTYRKPVVAETKKELVEKTKEDVLEQNIKNIKHLVMSAARNFCMIGYYLKQIRDSRQYEAKGYADIWECAQAEFGFSKSVASRHMKMNDMFSIGGNSTALDEKYKGFNKSQLTEMMYLEEKDRMEVTTDMPVAEIRKLNPNSKAGKEEENESVATSQQQESDDFILSIRKNCIFQSDRECNFENIREVAHSCGIDCAYKCCYSCDNELCGARCTTSVEKRRLTNHFSASIPKNVTEPEAEPEETKEDIIEADYREVEEAKKESKQAQPELPQMKNMDQREEFIKSFKTWPVWCVNELTQETFYRYDLPDGSAIVVRYYPSWMDWKKEMTYGKTFYLLKPDYKAFHSCETNMTSLKDHLKDLQKK